MKGNVLEAELRRARRVSHLGRVRFMADCGFRGSAHLQDLSTTGCRLISKSPLQVGMEFELELSLLTANDEPDIAIELAKVRWMDGDCVGLEFLAIYPPERERLRQFLKRR